MHPIQECPDSKSGFLQTYKIHIIIVGDSNTPLSILDRSVRQKINKDIQDLHSALDQMDIIDI